MTETADGRTHAELVRRGRRRVAPAHCRERFRRDRPVVPVVRLTGIIGFSTPLRPGLSLAGIARTLDRAFATKQCRRGRACHQFAGRFAGAIAPDLPPHPRTGGRAQAPRHRFRRRCRRLGRLHDRLRRPTRSSPIRIPIVGSIGVVGGSFGFDKLIAKIGIERRLYTVRRAQGDARSVPAGRTRTTSNG